MFSQSIGKKRGRWAVALVPALLTGFPALAETTTPGIPTATPGGASRQGCPSLAPHRPGLAISSHPTTSTSTTSVSQRQRKRAGRYRDDSSRCHGFRLNPVTETFMDLSHVRCRCRLRMTQASVPCAVAHGCLHPATRRLPTRTFERMQHPSLRGDDGPRE